MRVRHWMTNRDTWQWCLCLGSCSPHLFIGAEAWQHMLQDCLWSPNWRQDLCAIQVCLWIASWQLWSTWTSLQEGSGAFQSPLWGKHDHQEIPCIHWHSQHPGTPWPLEIWWKETRWTITFHLERRKILGLGLHNKLHFGTLTHLYFCARFWQNSWSQREIQVWEVLNFGRQLLLRPNSNRNFRCHGTPHQTLHRWSGKVADRVQWRAKSKILPSSSFGNVHTEGQWIISSRLSSYWQKAWGNLQFVIFVITWLSRYKI